MLLRLALIVFVGFVIIIAGFAFFIPHANQGGEKAPLSEVSVKLPHLTFTDTYAGGMHTIAGKLAADTPCTSVNAIASIATGTPVSILVEVTTTGEDTVCLQQKTDISFSVEATAPKDAAIITTVNGVTVTPQTP